MISSHLRFHLSEQNFRASRMLMVMNISGMATRNTGTAHSPILFPIVCGLWKDTYRTEGKEYHLPRHGFARDTEFKLVGKTADRLTFALIDNEETQKNYPYHFNLAISYRLQGNEIHVIWHVENTNDKEIFFQIGGHPAFMVPGCKKGEEMKATLKLDNEAPCSSSRLG